MMTLSLIKLIQLFANDTIVSLNDLNSSFIKVSIETFYYQLQNSHFYRKLKSSFLCIFAYMHIKHSHYMKYSYIYVLCYKDNQKYIFIHITKTLHNIQLNILKLNYIFLKNQNYFCQSSNNFHTY